LGRAVRASQFLVSWIKYDLGRPAIKRGLRGQPDLCNQQNHGGYVQDKFPPTPQEIEELLEHLPGIGGWLLGIGEQRLPHRRKL
jgi:hypothetical protein